MNPGNIVGLQAQPHEQQQQQPQEKPIFRMKRKPTHAAADQSVKRRKVIEAAPKVVEPVPIVVVRKKKKRRKNMSPDECKACRGMHRAHTCNRVLCDQCYDLCSTSTLPGKKSFSCSDINLTCSPIGDAVVGFQFFKNFPGYGGEWEGQVVRFDSTQKKPYVGRFNDGTEEEYTLKELRNKYKLYKPSPSKRFTAGSKRVHQGK